MAAGVKGAVQFLSAGDAMAVMHCRGHAAISGVAAEGGAHSQALLTQTLSVR